MDIKRAKPVKRLSPQAWAGIGVLAVGIAIYFISTLDFTSRRVDRHNLLIGTVEYGDLAIKVGANGVLLAKEEQFLSVEVDGRVARLNVKPGAHVHKGQVLAELTNSSVVRAAEQAASALDGAVAEKVSYQVELENALLNQRSALMQAQFDLEKAQLQLEADTKLIEKNIISEIDFQKSQLDVRQLTEKLNIDKERLDKAEANMKSLLTVRESRVSQAQKELERANERVASLSITAQMNGVVQEINMEIGQQLQPGFNAGRIARQDVLYAELKVPERQASEVVIGQRVEVDTRNGVIEGRVSRIDPAVVDGTVIVDVDLVSELPRSARPELAVEGTIYVAEIKNSLYTGKPAFTRVNSQQTVYKLDAEGRYAERIVIDVGQASVNYIEILGGLKEGDKIILSDSSEWQDYNRIMLN